MQTITDWHKSSYSGEEANCVERRVTSASVDVRDSKDKEGAVLTFGPGAWMAFVADLHTDERFAGGLV